MNTKKMVFVVGGATSALFLGAGVASAVPDADAIANMTCTYPQVEAALNAQSPQVAGELLASPVATWWVQSLVGSPPDQRRQMLFQVEGMPEVQQYADVINRVAATCHTY